MSVLHRMKLHEDVFPGSDGLLRITRVPGGWIYTTYQEENLSDPQGCGRDQQNFRISSVFVPYCDEFATTTRGREEGQA